MDIRIKHFDGKYPSFNVSLASSKDAEEFLTIKGCKIVNGSNGPFVSWPSQKKDDGKYWNHVWANEKFAAAVLAKAQEGKPKDTPVDDDSDLPF